MQRFDNPVPWNLSGGKARKQEREKMKYTLTLTARELEALYAALNIANGSYDGWPADEIFSELRQDMKAWARIEAKIDTVTA